VAQLARALSARGGNRLVVGGLAATLAAMLAAGGVAAGVTTGRHDPPGGRTAARGEAAAHRLRSATDTAVSRRVASPSTGTPTVARLHRLQAADMIVTLPHPVTAAELRTVRSLPYVQGTVVVAEGSATVDHHQATLLGVDPSTFRSWTPLYTARSDALWRNVAAGDIAVSFDMGQGIPLRLGGSVPVRARRTASTRVGAFATVGLPGIDAIVSQQRAAAIGLPRRNAIIISAPRSNPVTLRGQVLSALPGAQVGQLRAFTLVRAAGEFLDNRVLDKVIRAAESRIGDPYVWGGDGPKAFDCSGLVGWSFAQAGILLPRTAAQLYLAGPHVPYADARPGDLVFWHYDPTDPGYIDHVALYIGHGMMVVAPHTGTDVSYSPVPMADFAGVVRVDPAMAAAVGGPRFP
jgi:cell wall-associated NlpC family hydrolase